MTMRSDSSPANPQQFLESFERWAHRVRRRLLLRRALHGVSIGLVLAASGVAVAWWARQDALRPYAFALGALGMLAGLWYGLRRAWSDQEVALYLDARLQGNEVISTAIELCRTRTRAGALAPGAAGPADGPDETCQTVVRHALGALGGASPTLARPRICHAWHGIAPVGAAIAIWLNLAPLPPAPPLPPTPPGVDKIVVDELQGLEKIVVLESLHGRTPEQTRRLKKIAEDAKKLREDLKKGLEKREALARIAELRDDIAAERLNFGDEKNRAGLEAAVGRLNQNEQLKKAAKALGEGDLTAFDKEMQKLANQAEERDRDAAKEALEDAIERARSKGAEDLARSLEQQRELFERREAESNALRELARELEGSLGEQGRKDLDEFGESGSPEARRRLAQALEEALDGMSPAERKRLADNLKKRLQSADGAQSPLTKEQIEELARRLESDEGKEALKKQLQDLARAAPSEDAQREEGLGEADRGGADAQKGLGAVPMPLGGSPNGSGKPGPGNQDRGNQASGKDPGGSGSGKDEGPGEHDGKTDAVGTEALRSKAGARVDTTAPMHGATMGRAPARPGETANQTGTGALGKTAPSDLGGAEHSEVPEEYREQVGRYFQP